MNLPSNKKYDFYGLEIGESRYISGDFPKIQKAAAMYGRRTDIWFIVTKATAGATIKRVAQPQPKTVRVHDSSVKRIEDGVRFLCVMVTQMKQRLDELEK